MPQLNPTPWFFILILSWLTFLIIIPSKVMGHSFATEPTAQNVEKPNPEPLNWPWP
uniref:ATP synthase complex subunit 8 n=2 Tax=Atractosteus TaxID=512340 RepID=Q8HMN0_ATRSP|nr:ATP synthase F0 subunit 8 [Atractosteus tristoechus]YP_636988.1 ATP synthase F0 subunit 8 [Atractosteus spatula]ATO90657.1 ATP synthase F0 subunit 8 [Atractosteus tristoechus]BAC23988.1 ATPase subunits 8 [Atractosteus spatula]